VGKKRSYQWQAVRDEAGATDYKTMPNEPAEADVDDRKLSRAMEGKFKGGQPVPPNVLEPRAARARAREMLRQNHLQQQRGRSHHIPTQGSRGHHAPTRKK
jgi:hypothetical protein